MFVWASGGRRIEGLRRNVSLWNALRRSPTGSKRDEEEETEVEAEEEEEEEEEEGEGDSWNPLWVLRPKGLFLSLVDCVSRRCPVRPIVITDCPQRVPEDS
eukprot:5440158-Pyramimonas_sp.AAC.1